MLIGCAMYVDALKPVSLLSLTLQKEGADIVTSIENTLKSVKALKTLSELAPIEWPSVKLVKSRLKDVGHHKEYQGVALQNFDRTLEQCKKHVMDDICKLEEKIKERLEWSDIQLMRSILVFLETQSWQKSFSELDSHDDHEDVDDFAEVRAAVEYIISIFRIPLEAKGMCVAQFKMKWKMLYPTQGSTFQLVQRTITKSGTKFTLVQTPTDGPTFSCCVSYCSAYLSPLAVLSNFSRC